MPILLKLIIALTLTIPSEVESLPEEAFRDRTDLSEVRFAPGSRLRELPVGLFRGCSNLRRVDLPDSLVRIGAHAFAYCSRLDSIRFPATLRRVGNNAFSRCISLSEVSLPDSVTMLESYAFSDCTALRSARLPANDSLLGELIFSGCESLVELVEPSPVPPPFDCDSFIFEPEETAMYRRCRLSVPTEASSAYSRSPAWSLFNR